MKLTPRSRWKLSRSAHAFVVLLLGAALVSNGRATAENSSPNIVVIIADDLGYGETEVMGNFEIPTPNVKALSQRGVTCRSAYVTSSYCSPSRAGILTGRYQSRFGYDINPTGKRNLLANAGLPTDQVTFVKRLSAAGYQTGLVGKWHLGGSEAMHPMQRGFNSFYGFLHEGHFYKPGTYDADGSTFEDVLTMVRDNSLKKGQRKRVGNLIRGNYSRINEPPYDQDNPLMRGTETIEESRYLTHAISEEAVTFIDTHHEEPFCMVVAFNAVHSPMQAELAAVRKMARIDDVQRRIFAGMLMAMDDGIGRIVDRLDEHRLLRETLIVFISDNGGPTVELTSSNAPLRGEKGSLYEGGVRVPMIWSMPGRLPEDVVETRTVLSLDIAATALDLADVKVSAEDPSQLDGRSVLDWMNDPLANGHETVFWRMPGGKQALRSGNWKIVRPKEDQPIELYHLASDIAEKQDLSSQEPARLRELTNRWQAMNAVMAKPIELRTSND